MSGAGDRFRTNISAIFCADWAKEQRKRAVFVADVNTRKVSRVGHADWSVARLLEFAQPWTEKGPVLVTFDAPLGVPASYFEAALRSPLWGGPQTFLELLRCAWLDPGYLDTTVSAEEWTVERPFFNVPAGEGGLRSYIRAAEMVGVDLYRQIDRLTKAKSVFVKSGIPGTVGSGACALWKELGRCLTRQRSFAVWPFDGDWEWLLVQHKIVLGEIYPRIAYATALLNAPPLLRPPLSVAKTNGAVRGAAIQALLASDWIEEHNVIFQDLDAAAGSEDDFDACITAAALLRCLLDGTPVASVRMADEVAEGGILGAAAINLDLPERIFRPEIGSCSEVIEGYLPTRRNKQAAKQYRCPIPACNKMFIESRGGWDGHVGSVRIHPEWYPDLLRPDDRKRRFERDFPQFFE